MKVLKSLLLCLLALMTAVPAPAAETVSSLPQNSFTPAPSASLELSPMPAAELEPVPEGGYEIVVTIGGDCTLGSEDDKWGESTSFIQHITRLGYLYPFANMKDMFEKDDLTVINFEGVLAENPYGKITKTYNFRAPTDYAKIMPLNSIEAVTLGNNHSGDYGQQGFDSTVKALDDAGVNWFVNCPQGNRVYVYEKDGIKIGFLGFYVGYWRANRGRINQSLKELKEKGCSTIVAIMHGGSEYSQRHDGSQKNMAMSCIEQGASVVIGHHPHVLQGLEKINDATIVYSLGNFAFGGNKRIKPMADTALVVQVRFLFNKDKQYVGHQMTLHPIHPSGTFTEVNNFQPVFAKGAEAQRIMGILQSDTASFPLMPFVEGRGAVQAFVPAPAPIVPSDPMDVHISMETM